MQLQAITTCAAAYPYKGLSAATMEPRLHPEKYEGVRAYVLGHAAYDRYIIITVNDNQVKELDNGTIVLLMNPKYFTPSNPPIVIGKAFVGWYSDEECTKPMHMIGQGSSYPTERLYARFVDESLLTNKTAIAPGRRCYVGEGENCQIELVLLTATPKDTAIADVGFAFTIGNLPPHWHMSEDPRTMMVPNPSEPKDPKHPRVELVTNFGAYSGLHYEPIMFHESNAKYLAVAKIQIPKAASESVIRIAAYYITKDGSRVYGPINSLDIHKRLAWDEWNGQPMDPTDDNPMEYMPKVTFEPVSSTEDVKKGDLVQVELSVDTTRGSCKALTEVNVTIKCEAADYELPLPAFSVPAGKVHTYTFPVKSTGEDMTFTVTGSYKMAGYDAPFGLSLEPITFKASKED